jgi:hypothetical protein
VGRAGAATRRNLGDSNGQEGTTNVEVSSGFSAIDVGSEIPGLGFHTAEARILVRLGTTTVWTAARPAGLRLILGLVTSPASARPPQREVVRSSGSLLLADCGDDVLLTETFTEVHTFTTFFDASSNPIRVQIHENFDGVITNSASGNTYRDPGHWTIVMDLVNGTGTLHGEFYAIVAPGVGIIIQDTGTITYDADGNIIFQAGPHEFFTGTADFCSILV